MTGKNVSNIVEKKIQELRRKRADILNMEPDDAVSEILDHRESLPLVHSFPEQSLYMLMNEVGYEDFLPVLSMATKKQWEYIIDQEVWDKDEIDIHKASRWLGVLHMADPARLAEWLMTDQENFLYYYLRNKIDVVLREHDEDPSPILGAGFTTIDDVIYYKVEDNDENAEKLPLEAKSLVQDILLRIADKSYPMFQTVIFSAAGVLNAEHCEHLYRLRNSRLEEKGLLPFEEAVEVYAPLVFSKIQKRTEYEKIKKENMDEFFDKSGSINSDALMDVFSIDNYFADSDIFSVEFVSLCNQVIVTDKKPVKTRDELNRLVKRVSGLLKVGAQAIDKDMPVNLVFESYRLKDIFRAGNTSIRRIRDKVMKWQKKSWITRNSFNISFLGEKWFGILGGLLVWPCVYYDNYETTDVVYRTFNTMDDVAKTDEEIEQIIALDDLFSLMDVKEIDSEGVSLGWENFILTLWARDWLHFDESVFEPVDVDRFKDFYEWLWEDAGENHISKDKKQDFLNWIVRSTEIEPDLLVKRLGSVFDHLFELIESEFKYVDSKHLNPKYIDLFVVK